jgi:hypothetical protein
VLVQAISRYGRTTLRAASVRTRRNASQSHIDIHEFPMQPHYAICVNIMVFAECLAIPCRRLDHVRLPSSRVFRESKGDFAQRQA